jgi:hypothetical protein
MTPENLTWFEPVGCTEMDERHSSRDLARFAATLRQMMAISAHDISPDVWDRTIRTLMNRILVRHQGIMLEVATHLAHERRLDEPRAMALSARAERRWGLQPGPLAGDDW